MATKKNTEYQNDVNLTGFVFSANFRTGTSKATSKWHPNEGYISGNLNIATDEDAMNVVPVNFFVYENRNNKDGDTVPNETYQTLLQIMNGPTYETAGDKAPKVRISATVDTNDFYSSRTDDIVSAQRVNGRFIHVMSPGTSVTPANFDVNAVVTSAVEREVEGRDPYLDVRGYVFNYNGTRLFPVRFECQDKSGQSFLLGMEPSSTNPVVMNIWGSIQNTVIEKAPAEQEEVANGFGVRPVISGNNVSTVRSWVITGADTGCVPEFGDVAPFTKNDMKRLIDERNVRLEEVKQSGMARAGKAAFSGTTVKKAPAQVFAQKTSASDIYDMDGDIPF